MIGRIQGVLLEVDAQHILIDVSGVGYELEVPFSTAYALPRVGESVTLHTHFVVREDAQLLYGFISKNDRSLFRILIKINGVGPKLAIAILSGLSASELVRCINSDDVATLVKLPGIGKKTAERLVIEMRDKVKSFSVVIEGNGVDSFELTGSGQQSEDDQALSDAEDALVALGYKPASAVKVVKLVYKEGLSTQDIIRLALQKMVS